MSYMVTISAGWAPQRVETPRSVARKVAAWTAALAACHPELRRWYPGAKNRQEAARIVRNDRRLPTSVDGLVRHLLWPRRQYDPDQFRDPESRWAHGGVHGWNGRDGWDGIAWTVSYRGYCGCDAELRLTSRSPACRPEVIACVMRAMAAVWEPEKGNALAYRIPDEVGDDGVELARFEGGGDVVVDETAMALLA